MEDITGPISSLGFHFVEGIFCLGLSLRVPAVEGVPTPRTERYVPRCVHHERRLSYGGRELSFPRLGSVGGSEGSSSSEPNFDSSVVLQASENKYRGLVSLNNRSKFHSDQVPGVFYTQPCRTQPEQRRFRLRLKSGCTDYADHLFCNTTTVACLVTRR